jgi:hypothetical protein
MQLIEAQARAEALHQDLDNILRSMPIGVLIHNSDYIVEYVNDAWYDISEFPKDERFEGRPYRDLIAKHFELERFDSGRSVDDIYEARLAALRKAGPHLQTEVNFADGKSVIIDARRISNGRTLMSYTDISSVKQQSQEITETRLALERHRRAERSDLDCRRTGAAVRPGGRTHSAADGIHLAHLPFQHRAAIAAAVRHHHLGGACNGADAAALIRRHCRTSGRRHCHHGVLPALPGNGRAVLGTVVFPRHADPCRGGLFIGTSPAALVNSKGRLLDFDASAPLRVLAY